MNGFFQRDTVRVVFRQVKDTPTTFEDLNLGPDSRTSLCHHNLDRHVATLEDPIEFTYTDIKSIFNQSEVGIDLPSFEMDMKSVLRQDPDIILIGEMRDRDTFATALSTTETGHRVFETIHSSNAQQEVQRLFEYFLPDQQESDEGPKKGNKLAMRSLDGADGASVNLDPLKDVFLLSLRPGPRPMIEAVPVPNSFRSLLSPGGSPARPLVSIPGYPSIPTPAGTGFGSSKNVATPKTAASTPPDLKTRNSVVVFPVWNDFRVNSSGADYHLLRSRRDSFSH